jgi:Phage-related minor tail protein.
MNIADILASVHLNLETGEFEASAIKSADKVGATFGSKLKTALRGAIGAGIGLGVGAVLTGANQLDAATRQLQADTGMTAQEAGKAEHALAGMYRNNLQGFDAIGAAMAKVHNDLGLTGAAADATTAKFLKFSTATGQDAAAAVTQADDTLDAWNLTAADSGPLLDGLIADHQKFGGVISDSESALAKLAPAMTAANLTIDDGRGLLNLFNVAGIDASKAPVALAHALSLVKSPEELKRLIADITATKDPFERAQKAIALFGARAGPQLAAALASGGLDTYTIDANTAAGATEKAAAAVESGFGAQFKLILKNAGGALAEFGTNFGDLAMIASAFGPGMVKAIGGALGGLAGLIGPRLVRALAALLPSAVVAGTAQGAAMGGAAAASEVATETAGVVAGQAVVGATAAPAAATAGTGIGTAMGTAAAAALVKAFILAAPPILIATDILDKWNRANDTTLTNAQKLGGTKLFGYFGPDIQLLRDNVAAAMADLANFPGKVADDLGVGTPVVAAAADRLWSTIPWALRNQFRETSRAAADIANELPTALQKGGAAVAAAAEAWMRKPIAERLLALGIDARLRGANIALALAGGMRDSRSAVDSAMAQLRTDIKNAMSPKKLAAKDIGLLIGKDLIAGLYSSDPMVKKQAGGTRSLIENALIETIGAGGAPGEKIMAKLEKDLNSKDPKVKIQAQRTKGIIDAALKDKAAGKTPGDAIGDQLNADLGNKGSVLGKTAYNLGRTIFKNLYAGVKGTGYVRPVVPNVTGSGGSGVSSTKVGNIGFASGIDFVPYDMTAFIHRGEAVLTASENAARMTVAAPARGGDTYHNTWVMPEPTRDPWDVLEATSRYVRWGRLRPVTS